MYKILVRKGCPSGGNQKLNSKSLCACDNLDLAGELGSFKTKS